MNLGSGVHPERKSSRASRRPPEEDPCWVEAETFHRASISQADFDDVNTNFIYPNFKDWPVLLRFLSPRGHFILTRARAMELPSRESENVGGSLYYNCYGGPGRSDNKTLFVGEV